MQTTAVYVQNLCVPCENRCRYCLLSYDGKLRGIDYKRSEAYARRFNDWIKCNRPELSFVFYFGYSMEHPDLFSAVRFFQEIGSPSGRFLQFDGMKFREQAELTAFLSELKESGIELIDLTFYGTREYHDRFAARSGDFDYMMNILKTANSIGLDVNAGIALSHENAGQIDDLIELLEGHMFSRLYCFVPHEEGRGETLNSVRFSKVDYQQLSEKSKTYINTERFRTESEWLTLQPFPKFEKRAVAVSLTPDNIERFETMSFEETIAYLEKLDDAYHDAIPEMAELMRLYGDTNGEEFYSVKDLCMHYQRRYIREHGLEVYDINDERQCFVRRF